MKILITGASGFFGSKLFSRLVRNHDVAGTSFSQERKSKQHLDITDNEKVDEYFKDLNPDVVVHTAAISDANFCEENKEDAVKINVEGTRNIAEACKKYDTKMIFISSDYVFDGNSEEAYDEDSPTNPVNFYGKTKVDGEEIVKKLDNSVILRPAILYGFSQNSTKETFVEKVVKSLEEGNEIEIDNVIMKYPLLIDTLAKAVNMIIDKDEKGIFNISSEKGVTRYEWALIIAKTFGFDKSLIKETTAEHPATKPKNVCFSTQKIKNMGLEIESVERGMKIYKSQKGCMFRMIYSVKPHQLVLGNNASSFRIRVGREIAKEFPVDADVVFPVPESGIFGSTGFSAESGIPIFFGVIRDYYTRKTLFESNKGLRSELLRKKLIFISELIKWKKIVIVDEAIVSGTTLEFVVKKLKEEGAKEIHIRIPSPPMRFNCNFKVLDSKANLLASEFEDEKDYNKYKEMFESKLKEHFGVESLRFLSKEGFLKCLKSDKEPCMYCFN